MIKILDKPKLAYMNNEGIHMVIGTYYNYPLALNLKDILIRKNPEELSRDMLTIFTEGKYYIPLDNYIRFSTIRGEKNFYKEKFWSEEEWDKFKSLWRTMKQSVDITVINNLCYGLLSNRRFYFIEYISGEKTKSIDRKDIYFYFTKGFEMRSVYGSKTYRYHLGDPYFEILKHPENPDQTVERTPFFIDSNTTTDDSSVDWFNTPQFKAMNKFMKIAKEIFDIDLTEEEDIVYG